MKAAIASIWLVIFFAGITSLFWYNAFVYSFPTPLPDNYEHVDFGEKITFKEKMNGGNPLFLHFFNPDCSCSKINISSFNSLVKRYRKELDFKIVVVGSTKNFTPEQIQNKFKVNVPVLFDTSIVRSCGVYATPQAVILDADGRLYYRGNYNRSRYCTDKKSNYARMAIESLLQQKTDPVFSHVALKAYGCKFPECNKLWKE